MCYRRDCLRAISDTEAPDRFHWLARLLTPGKLASNAPLHDRRSPDELEPVREPSPSRLFFTD
jgi:hypothetical protein